MTVRPHHVVDGPADGPVLVLVGSLGSTVEMWRPQLPALVGRFRVVRVDLPGHGASPAQPGEYRMAELPAGSLRAGRRHTRTLAAGIPGARLEIIPGAHVATIESAAAANRLLLGHLYP